MNNREETVTQKMKFGQAAVLDGQSCVPVYLLTVLWRDGVCFAWVKTRGGLIYAQCKSVFMRRGIKKVAKRKAKSAEGPFASLR